MPYNAAEVKTLLLGTDPWDPEHFIDENCSSITFFHDEN